MMTAVFWFVKVVLLMGGGRVGGNWGEGGMLKFCDVGELFL